MRLAFLTISFLIFSHHVSGQMTIDGKPLNDEQKKMVKEAFTKKRILSETAVSCCTCIDSISISDKDAKENAIEIRKCIDKEVVAYQSSLKLLETVDLKEGDKVTISIYTNPESAIYKQYYYEIEKQLMDSCQSIKNVVGRNNKEGERSVSTNSAAIKEYNRGNEYLRKDDYKNALPFYERAVLFDPNFAFAWDNIGVCSRRVGNFDRALEAYEMSLKLDPKGMTALQNIPLVYVSKKRYKKAIDSYENLAALDGNNPEVYYGIGKIYFENLMENEKALDNMCKAYNLYIAQNSPYRTDAEKIIQRIYSKLKSEGKEAIFDKILEANNISQK
jgi:tetratricopeptide (TPR) repeat protein